MKKILFCIFLFIFLFNPLALCANEISNSNGLIVKDEIDYIDRNNSSIISYPDVYLKSFKLMNNGNQPLIIQKIETVSGFNNQKGYKNLRIRYSDVVLDSIILSLILFPFLLRIPYYLVIAPVNNLNQRNKLMSIKKFQTGKYKLKPNKSIMITIVPTTWKSGGSDELVIYYKTSKNSSEISTFRYPFKYSAKAR